MTQVALVRHLRCRGASRTSGKNREGFVSIGFKRTHFMPLEDHSRSPVERPSPHGRPKMLRYLSAAALLTFLVLASASPLARLRREGRWDPGIDPDGVDSEAIRGDLSALKRDMEEIHRELEKNLEEEFVKTLEEQVKILKQSLGEVERELTQCPDEATRKELEEYKKELEEQKEELELELEKRLYQDLEEVRRELDDQDFAHRADLSEAWHELREWSQDLEKELRELAERRGKM